MKIAAIAAFPFAMNPGMISVDRAVIDVLQDAGRDCELDLFCLEKSFTLETGYLDMDYAALRDPAQLEAYDRIIFWGDFLHWNTYARTDVASRMLKAGAARSPEEVREMWFKLMLLEDRPDLRKRSIVFGSTIYGLGAADLADRRYVDAIRALYRDAVLVALRDVLSAGFASQLCGNSRDHLGCDCAFFLHNRLNDPASIQQRGGHIACAFGRSGATTLYRSFTGLMAKASGLSVQELAWLDCQHARDLEPMIGAIGDAAFVVTDVYHVAVTALREGTPAICLAHGASAPSSTIADKKKEVLFSQYFAGGSLVFHEVLHEAMYSDRQARHLVEQCLKTLRDPTYNEAVFANIREQVARQRARLHAAIYADQREYAG